MKILSLIILVLALASCSKSGGGDGNNGGLGAGPGAGTPPAVKTGVAINNDSSVLAKNIVGKSWCSQKQYFEPNDTNNQNPFVEVFKFFDTGKMEVSYAEVNSGNQVEKTAGEWGASDTQLTLSAGGQTVNFDVTYDDAKKEITAKAAGSDAETYSQCNVN